MKIFEEMSSFIKRHPANAKILFYADLNFKVLSYTEQEEGKMNHQLKVILTTLKIFQITQKQV